MMRLSTGRFYGAAVTALLVLSAGAALADAAALHAAEETAPERFTDSHRTRVTVRVPVALRRGANAFRLYGARPLTLRDYDRRRDLYRDAFLELATRSHITPGASIWDPVSKQLDRARRFAPALKLGSELGEAAKQLPGYENLAALSKALRPGLPKVDAAQPVVDALELRALATDEASRRLADLGAALQMEDPAMRDGFQAAKAEFEQVRLGLWPAIAASVKEHQGQLAVSAAKDLVFSHLGSWVVFGYLGWQGVESALNAEYRGQYAICLATVASELEEAAKPENLPLALYAEYAYNYEITEALKSGELMGLKPAGGKSSAGWQLQCNARCEELKKLLDAKPQEHAAKPVPVPGE